jgi:hypothetical protein
MIKCNNSEHENNCDDCNCKEDPGMGTSCLRHKFPDIGELNY